MAEKKKWIIECKHVLTKTKEILQQQSQMMGVALASSQMEKSQQSEPLLSLPSMKFASISGVINTAECDRFKRFIFRISRGIF